MLSLPGKVSTIVPLAVVEFVNPVILICELCQRMVVPTMPTTK